MLLVLLIASLLGVLAEDFLDRPRLRLVAQRRAGAVGVDVLDVVGIEPGIAQGRPHGHGGPGPARDAGR